MLAPAELKEIHALGKSPVISIEAEGMSKPLILAESGLIIEYLIDHFKPELAPPRYVEGKEGQIGGESEEWLRYRYFMHYTEGSLMILMVVAILVGCMYCPCFLIVDHCSNNLVLCSYQEFAGPFLYQANHQWCG